MPQVKIFNRDRETAEILEFLAHSSGKLLLVTGESGCGKSAIVDRALAEAVGRQLMSSDSVLSYRFAEKAFANEGERFPQFLMDSYAALRPSWSLDMWMRRHGTYPDTWALRLPTATFNFKMVNFKEPQRAAPFFNRFALDMAARYRVFRLENGENYQAEQTLRILEQLVAQKVSPKVIVEIGTLTADDSTIIRFLEESCLGERLKVELFDPGEAHQCFHFIHEKEAPSALLEISRGNALAIRHYGTALADLPAGDRVRRRLEGFSSEAMILLWCLTALRGSAEVDFLNQVSGLGSAFDAALIKLRMADVVRYESGVLVKFSHSLFGPYFMSEQFSADIDRYGRKRIIGYLEGKTAKSVADTHELARQYQAQGELDAAWKWAARSALESYRQQDFRTVADLAEILDACESVSPLSKQQANMLLLQTAVRTGDQGLATERLQHLREDPSGVTTLLRAQACYLMNCFEEGARLCGTVAHLAGDEFLTSRALGIRAACYIAVGRHQEAADDFALAKTLAAEAGDRELEMEILRLSPEVEPEPVWRERYGEIMGSELPDQYPYLHAKCLHNLGAFLALTTDGADGLDQITTAMAVFKAGHYPEYSYSAVLLSATMLLLGKLGEARELLETSEIWCHEQYDTFGVKTNLGVSYALEEDWTMASGYFEEAERSLSEGDYPLLDPYFHFLSQHNRAITKAGMGEFREAVALLESTVVPQNAYDYEPKAARREHFLRLLRDYQVPSARDLPTGTQRWATKACVMEPATLQFFDFNINVLPPMFSLA